MTIMVNAGFSSKASFQLFIFCWVGYIHGNAIVPFFFGLSKGDAKGNWIFHMIIGLGYLPFFVIFALVFGFQYAVLGQLMTFFGTIYLSRRLKPKMDWITFCRWLIKPLYSSLLLMVVACCFHGGIYRLKTLARALSLVLAKLGISEKLVFRLMGIKSL